jgi:hypothetical protein
MTVRNITAKTKQSFRMGNKTYDFDIATVSSWSVAFMKPFFIGFFGEQNGFCYFLFLIFFFRGFGAEQKLIFIRVYILFSLYLEDSIIELLSVEW